MIGTVLAGIKRNGVTILLLLAVFAFFWLFVRRPRASVTLSSRSEELEMVTLLPRDAIPAIDEPQFLSTEEADSEYAPDELVLGITINGDSRAYSTAKLSSHEIVNDVVGGRPVSVTW